MVNKDVQYLTRVVYERCASVNGVLGGQQGTTHNADNTVGLPVVSRRVSICLSPLIASSSVSPDQRLVTRGSKMPLLLGKIWV